MAAKKKIVTMPDAVRTPIKAGDRVLVVDDSPPWFGYVRTVKQYSSIPSFQGKSAAMVTDGPRRNYDPRKCSMMAWLKSSQFVKAKEYK